MESSICWIPIEKRELTTTGAFLDKVIWSSPLYEYKLTLTLPDVLPKISPERSLTLYSFVSNGNIAGISILSLLTRLIFLVTILSRADDKLTPELFFIFIVNSTGNPAKA